MVILPDIYINAGGVTFHILNGVKNLSHISFGRLERRFGELQGKQIIDVLETMLNKQVPEQKRRALVTGASEHDLVRSGLDETMRTAYQEIHEAFYSRQTNKRENSE